MDRLTLCQKVNEKAGTQGSLESTTNINEYQQVLVGMVDTAYNDIQLLAKGECKFMRLSVSPTITSADPTYTNTDIKKIRKVIYNQNELTLVDYDDWIMTDHSTGEPTEYTVIPATGVITFNPLDANYVITVQYLRVPNIMTGDYDIPIIPLSFHWTIVWKALMELGSYVGNWDLISTYTDKYSIEAGDLLRDQNPQKEITKKPFVTPVQFA